jgi:hypothetical protein
MTYVQYIGQSCRIKNLSTTQQQFQSSIQYLYVMIQTKNNPQINELQRLSHQQVACELSITLSLNHLREGKI